MKKTYWLLFLLVFLILLSLGATLSWYLQQHPTDSFAPSPSPSDVSAAPIVSSPATPALPHDQVEAGLTTPTRIGPFEVRIGHLAYSADRVVGDLGNIPAIDKKYFLLSYTFTNRSPENASGYHGISWIAVDTHGNRYSPFTNLDPATHKTLEGEVESGAVRQALAAFEIPNDAVITQTLIDQNNGTPPTRYSVKQAIQPLPPPFADPQDATAATLLKKVPAVIGAAYPVTYPFDVTVDSITRSATPIGNVPAENGKEYVIVNLTLQNKTNLDQSLIYNLLDVTLLDVKGAPLHGNVVLFKAISNDPATDLSSEPNGILHVRSIIPVFQETPLTSLTLRFPSNNTGRYYVYPVENVPPAPALPPANPPPDPTTPAPTPIATPVPSPPI